MAVIFSHYRLLAATGLQRFRYKRLKKTAQRNLETGRVATAGGRPTESAPLTEVA